VKTPSCRFLIIAVLVAGWTSAGGAFAENGHRVIGHLAELRLQGSRAIREARRILRSQETLADAAVWPDTIKNAAYEDGDTALFRLEHPAHDVYHYTNLPFQVDRYAADVPGARENDILQVAIECIRVLRGTSQGFTPREALRLLAHLIGDMHQPLHVGNGYLPATGPLQFVVPTGPTGWRVTLGGNALVYGPQDRFNLHSYWDAHAVNLTMGRESAAAFASRLLKDVPAGSDWKGTGPAETWPEQWVNEAIPRARAAYTGIVVTSYLGPDESGRTPHRWRIQQPAGYDDLARRLLQEQLARAGYRLAAVLETIWPGAE
jgi:hypothetical protein